MPRGTYVLIEVSDTGIGIPKETLGRIFEPFFSDQGTGGRDRVGLVDCLWHCQQTKDLSLSTALPDEEPLSQDLSLPALRRR